MWSHSGYKQLKLAKQPFAACTLNGLWFRMQNIALYGFSVCCKRDSWGVSFTHLHPEVNAGILRSLSPPQSLDPAQEYTYKRQYNYLQHVQEL